MSDLPAHHDPLGGSGAGPPRARVTLSPAALDALAFLRAAELRGVPPSASNSDIIELVLLHTVEQLAAIMRYGDPGAPQ